MHKTPRPDFAFDTLFHFFHPRRESGKSSNFQIRSKALRMSAQLALRAKDSRTCPVKSFRGNLWILAFLDIHGPSRVLPRNFQAWNFRSRVDSVLRLSKRSIDRYVWTNAWRFSQQRATIVRDDKNRVFDNEQRRDSIPSCTCCCTETRRNHATTMPEDKAFYRLVLIARATTATASAINRERIYLSEEEEEENSRRVQERPRSLSIIGVYVPRISERKTAERERERETS